MEPRPRSGRLRVGVDVPVQQVRAEGLVGLEFLGAGDGGVPVCPVCRLAGGKASRLNFTPKDAHGVEPRFEVGAEGFTEGHASAGSACASSEADGGEGGGCDCD